MPLKTKDITATERAALLFTLRQARPRMFAYIAQGQMTDAIALGELLLSELSSAVVIGDTDNVNDTPLTDELLTCFSQVGPIADEPVLKQFADTLACWLAQKTNPHSASKPLWTALIAVKHEQDLMHALLSLWHKAHEFEDDIPLVFAQCEPDELEVMVPIFSKAEFVSLYHAVFYFSQQPQALFEQKLSAEKLLSVQHRLEQMYHFVLVLQQQFLKRCQQIITEPVPDHLFHGEVLPMGIQMSVSEAHRTCIREQLKDWTPRRRKSSVEDSEQEYIKDLARAYAFWFNPDRLIDACMMLHQLKPKSSSFDEYLLHCYQPLSTTQCMHLYGYFANKDSAYLMRTIKQAYTEQNVPWLGALSSLERNTLSDVYHRLNTLMNSLRETLKQRHIDTVAYPFIEQRHADKPRQRNRDAIRRILAVYAHQTPKNNHLAVEQLFDLLT